MKVLQPFNTPVLLITFNRPQYTKEVLSAIRDVKPKFLYVAMDGPREDNDYDKIAQKEIRDLISGIDWDCELHTLYQDNNLGCGLGPASAITWALENEDRVIVLEDDCVPNESFFAFCDEMLERYKYDTRVGIISGRSYQHGSKFFNNQDYIFTHYAHTLGWATWKRCWDIFDIRMTDFPEYIRMGGALNVLPVEESAILSNKRLTRIYTNIEKEVSHSWDSQCEYMFLKNNQLGIVPSENLIKYIGWFGTHDMGIETKSESIPTKELPDELRHPNMVMTDLGYEKLHFNKHIKQIHPPILVRVIRKIIREIKKIIGI